MTFILQSARNIRKGDRVQLPDSHLKGNLTVSAVARKGNVLVIDTDKGQTLTPDWADVWIGR